MNNTLKNFNEVINLAAIDLHIDARTRREAIEKLVDLLAAEHRISDKEVFIEEVFKREALETTNMGMGVAIPHGKSSAVSRNSIAMGRLEEPIDWDPDKMDEKQVSVVFLLAVRDDAEKDKVHLELISKVASLLIKEAFLEILFNTDDKTELLEQIFSLIGDE